MAVDSLALRELARDLGVGVDYWGWDGVQRSVSDSTLLAAMTALGYPVTNDEEIALVRAVREREYWERTLPPVTVMREDRDHSIAVHVDHGTSVKVLVEFENGTSQALIQVDDFTSPFDLNGTLRGQARFHLPAGLPLGYHRVIARGDFGEDRAELIVTPARLTTHEKLGSHRAFGLQTQLYSVRSQRSWGVGDLADMRDLAAITGYTHGADFLLVNPLHASFPVPPMEPSPYLPVTRRFTSALYLRIEDVPEFADLPVFARQRITLMQQDLADLNSDPNHLDRDQVLAAKMEALEELFAVPLSPAREALFAAYQEREGEALRDFAVWCALAEQVHGTDDDLLSRLTKRIVNRAHQKLADRVRFHSWVQWLLDEQMQAAQAAAVNAGMRIGIMHDLAVGVDPTGSDAWSLRHELASGVSVGAPADQYNQQGQNWHQPPWHPQRLEAAAYKPWRDMLRSLMRHAGALRIDHVLGLFRLWWIPEGNIAADGTYVNYDHDAMVGILALEAQRSNTIVIGEDLGTFEPWVREYLADRGIMGTSILWFEYGQDGSPLPPEDYRRLCLASVNTHDLPPTRGYLQGDHVHLRNDLGLLERDLHEELESDREGQEEVLALLRAEGLLDSESTIEETVTALHLHLARTPSLLVGVSLVDCVGERRIQNQPGTDEEYPNWRIPLADRYGYPVSVDDIAIDDATAQLLSELREAL